MNANTQFDLHPDAESLNAFAEEALAEEERRQVMGHLATCERCRQVVYLAQQAADEMEGAVVEEKHSAVGKRPWPRYWWFVWAPTAALAGLVAMTIFVHVRREATGAEMARVTRQTATQATLPMESGVARSATPASASGAAPVPEARAAGKPAPQSRKVGNENAEAALSAAPQMPAESGRREADLPTGSQGAGPPALGAAGEFKPAPADASEEREPRLAASAAQVDRLGTNPALEAKDNGSANRELSEGMVTAGTARPRTNSAPPASFDSGARHGVAGTFAVYRARAAELPSGLPAVSTVTGAHSMLAVDRAGSLYISEDAGVHWEMVERQWSGQAMMVRLHGEMSASTGTDTRSFEIVNDQGQVWVSADGRTWKAK